MRVLDVARPPPISPLLKNCCHDTHDKVSTEISFEEDEGPPSLINLETEESPQHKDQTGLPWHGK